MTYTFERNMGWAPILGLPTLAEWHLRDGLRVFVPDQWPATARSAAFEELAVGTVAVNTITGERCAVGPKGNDG